MRVFSWLQPDLVGEDVTKSELGGEASSPLAGGSKVRPEICREGVGRLGTLPTAKIYDEKTSALKIQTISRINR